MKLSRPERLYRMKFIQENHYDKDEQRIFDDAVKEMNMSYKTLYGGFRKGAVYVFMATIVSKRIADVFKDVSTTATEAVSAMAAFAEAFRAVV